MRYRLPSTSAILAAAAFSALLFASQAEAQAPYPRHRRAAQSKPAATATEPVTFRGLTINRQPDTGFSSDADEENIYRDGPIRYNDIRDFSPAPSVTSGVQYPYGFDGIGGYGSDLGFGAGQDSALYDRGAGGGTRSAP